MEHTSRGPLDAGSRHVAQCPLEIEAPEQLLVYSRHTVFVAVTFDVQIIAVPYSAWVYSHTGQIHFVWQW